MPKASHPDYGSIVDDIYLAFVHVLSADNDAELDEAVAEYVVPPDDCAAPLDDAAVAGNDDLKEPLATTERTPRKNFRRAA